MSLISATPVERGTPARLPPDGRSTVVPCVLGRGLINDPDQRRPSLPVRLAARRVRPPSRPAGVIDVIDQRDAGRAWYRGATRA